MKNKQQLWAVIHFLGGIKMLGSKKECEAWAKRNQLNPKHPIYVCAPVHGVRKLACDKCCGKGSILSLT